MSSANVSIIIPTYNGAHRILTVLESLRRQTEMPDEIILVIDGSTDNTKQLVTEQRYTDLPLKVIEQANGGRANVRNTGAALAKGDLLLFIDDDMIAPEDWVARHKELHVKYERALITGDLENLPAQLNTDFLQFKSWLHEKWTRELRSKPEDEIRLTEPYLTANNMSVPKILFNRLGGFDERLTDAEDYDLAVRGLRENVPLIFSRRAKLVNNDIDNVTCKKYIKRIREYTAAQLRLRALKPHLYGESHRYAAPPPQGIKGAIFKMFCKRFWIESVDNERWLFLPQNMRYKLYDVIITANGSFFPDKVNLQ